MNINHAKYFLELSRIRHLSRAARLLRISPTAISHAIAKLEEELGVALTTKVGRGIAITDKGVEFARKMEKIIRELDEIKNALDGNAISQGRYRMAMAPGLLPILFDRRFRDQIEDAREVTLEIQSRSSAGVIAEVLNGNVDIGICFSPLEHPNLLRKTLHCGRLVCVARETHPVFKTDSVARRVRILNEGFAIGAKASQGIENCESHPLFQKLNLSPQYRYIVDSYEAKYSVLSQTETWAFVPEVIAKGWKRIRPIHLGEYQAPYTVDAVWSKSQNPPLLFRNLLSSMRQRFES